MKAYYFVPADEAEIIAECGLEIAKGQYYITKVTQNSGKCFPARLNPRDYPKESFALKVKCIKIDLSKVRAYVAEEEFLNTNIPKEQGEQWFENSILPVEEYKPGMYRKPLCLIVNGILPEAIEPYDRFMDEPVVYENSEELFVDRLFSEAQEDDGFKETALVAHFKDKVLEGKMKMVDTEGHKVFFDTTDGRPYIFRKG